MPEVVINLITGLQAADIVQRWAEQICKQEAGQDWPAIEKRLKELSNKRDTPYGQTFFKALNAPRERSPTSP